MNTAESHPQRQVIIDAILAGEPLRSIGARVVPAVHHTTIARFKIKVLQQAVSNLKGKSDKHRMVKSIARDAGITDEQLNGESAVTESVRQAIQDRLEHRFGRRESWIQAAEAAENGPNHRALAAHDRNEGTDLEFLARLHGLAGGASGAATNCNKIAIVLMMPRDTDRAEAIDITPASHPEQVLTQCE